MIAPRTLPRLALIASMGLVAGCGGTTPSEPDTAEVIPRTDPAAKAAPPPGPTPEATPPKEVPKG